MRPDEVRDQKELCMELTRCGLFVLCVLFWSLLVIDDADHINKEEHKEQEHNEEEDGLQTRISP